MLSCRGVIAQQCWFLPRAQTTSAQKLQSYVLFFYLFIMSLAGCFIFKQKHESIVHLACQFMHLLCIFRTRRGADFFRQFVSGSGSFQVQQKVSWELLEKREKARMKRGWAELLHPWYILICEHGEWGVLLHLKSMASLLTAFTHHSHLLSLLVILAIWF